jgi:hypothetical protein
MSKEALEALIGTLDSWAAVFTLLVVLGVGGELVIHVLQSRANKKLIALQHTEAISQETEIARLRKEAGSYGLDIAKAKQGAAEALERAAKAEENLGNARKDAAEASERSAEANKIAEGERLERLKIQARLAPRTLSADQQQRIETRLKPFSGTPYELCVDPVPEAINLLTIVDAILRSAGWSNKESAKTELRSIITLASGSKVEQGYFAGVVVELTKSMMPEHESSASAFVLALQAEGIDARGVILDDTDPSPKTLHIMIGSKE